MPEIPRTKFNSPWTVAVIEAALNDVSSAKGSSESLTAALNAMRAEINSLSGGVHLKGAVDYYSDLPASPSEGDAYTVRYQGTSGTDPLGIEYAWATYQGTPQWIPIGVDPSVFAKQAEMNVVANAGAKNLFINEGQSVTGYGVACTINADGTISLNGTNTDKKCTGSFNIAIAYGQHMRLIEGEMYTLSVNGYPTSDTTIGVYVYTAGLTPYTQWDSYNRQTVVYNVGWNNASGFRLFIRQGTVVDNLTLKIMIRPAAITDPTFQPYAKTNRELTVITDEDRAALVEIVDGGAKNVLKLGFTTKTAGTVTGTMTADGNGIVVNGERTQTTDAILVYDLITDESASQDTRYTLPAGQYVLNAALTHVQVQIYCHDGTTASLEKLAQSSTSAVEFEYTAAKKQTKPYLCVRVWITRSHNYDNETIYPMICTKAAWNVSHEYQPYRPSWQEMYDMILAIQSGGNRALTIQTEPEEQEER